MNRTSSSAPTQGGRYAFLATGRWVGLIAVLLVVAVSCVLLGRWQWDRHTTRSAEVAQINAAYDAEPAPAEELLGSAADSTVTTATEWRPVRLQGSYLPGGTVLLRNRPVDGTPAVHVVTPFVAEVAGQELVVVVDRGWLKADAGLAEDPELPPAPEGEVSLVGRLRVAEEPFDRDAPPGQIYTLDPGQVLDGVATVADVSAVRAFPTLDGYVRAVDHEPASRIVPAAFPRPDTDLGPHLSYAFQWWIFALGAVGGLVVLARREARDRDEVAVEPRRPRRGSAEEEEDALVDAQLRAAADPAPPRR